MIDREYTYKKRVLCMIDKNAKRQKEGLEKITAGIAYYYQLLIDQKNYQKRLKKRDLMAI